MCFILQFYLGIKNVILISNLKQHILASYVNLLGQFKSEIITECNCNNNYYYSRKSAVFVCFVCFYVTLLLIPP